MQRKLALRLPYRVYGLKQMSCPNQSCISRVEHQESVPPHMRRVGSDRLRCYYCDQIMLSSQAF